MKTQVCFTVTGYMNDLSKRCCSPLIVDSVIRHNITHRCRNCHTKGVIMLVYTYSTLLILLCFISETLFSFLYHSLYLILTFCMLFAVSFLSYLILHTLFSFSVCYLLPSLSFLLLSLHLTLTLSLSFALLPYPQLLLFCFLLPLSLFPVYFILPITASCFAFFYSAPPPVSRL